MKNLVIYIIVAAICSGFWSILVGLLTKYARWSASVPWIVFFIGTVIGVFVLCIVGGACQEVDQWEHL